jgi:hypothetical protein
MHRRGFLKTTFASGLAVSGSACAGTRDRVASTPPLDDRELEHKLGRLDTTLARINGETTKQWFLREHEAELAQLERGERGAKQLLQHLRHEGELLRASMRTALLTSTVAELPEENRHDPRVIERIMRGSDEADYALFGNLELLRNLSAEQLAELDADLTSATNPGMDVAGRLDALSAELGVPTRRRLHLRRMAKHIDWRLQQERFSSVIADVVGQVDRMVESIRRGHAGELALAGPDPTWAARTHEIVAFYGSPTQASAEAEEWARQRREQQQQTAATRLEAEEKLREGQTLLGVGAGLLLVGGIAGGVGLGVGLSTFGTGFFVMAGIGAVALTVGIILLIVGAVVAGKAKRKLKHL